MLPVARQNLSCESAWIVNVARSALQASDTAEAKATKIGLRCHAPGRGQVNQVDRPDELHGSFNGSVLMTYGLSLFAYDEFGSSVIRLNTDSARIAAKLSSSKRSLAPGEAAFTEFSERLLEGRNQLASAK